MVREVRREGVRSLLDRGRRLRGGRPRADLEPAGRRGAPADAGPADEPGGLRRVPEGPLLLEPAHPALGAQEPRALRTGHRPRSRVRAGLRGPGRRAQLAAEKRAHRPRFARDGREGPGPRRLPGRGLRLSRECESLHGLELCAGRDLLPPRARPESFLCNGAPVVRLLFPGPRRSGGSHPGDPTRPGDRSALLFHRRRRGTDGLLRAALRRGGGPVPARPGARPRIPAGAPKPDAGASTQGRERSGARGVPVGKRSGGDFRTACTALVAAFSGDRARAQGAASSLESPTAWTTKAVVAAELGDRNAAMAAVEDGYRSHAADVLLLGADPAFDGLRQVPRFAALTASVGIRPLDHRSR